MVLRGLLRVLFNSLPLPFVCLAGSQEAESRTVCFDVLLALRTGEAVLGVFAVAVLTASRICRWALSCALVQHCKATHE